MIICLVVLRFFNGAQQLTTTSNSYNEMYADVRAIFDLMENDLKSIVYNNEISSSGTYPFAFSFYPIDLTSNQSPFRPLKYRNNIEKFYDKDFIPERYIKDIALEDKSGHPMRDYVPLLCFMANPSSRPSSATLPLCEIRYSFLPIGTDSSNKADTRYHTKNGSITSLSTENLFGGRIIRSITYADSTKEISRASTRHPHDAETFPMVDGSGNPIVEGATQPVDPMATSVNRNRIHLVFGDNSSAKFESVVDRVYRMNISCIKFDTYNGTNRFKKLKMFDINKTSITNADIRKEFSTDTDSTTPADSSYLVWPPEDSSSDKIYKYPNPNSGGAEVDIELLQMGHPLPDMIKVDLYMLSAKDWNSLMSYYDWNASTFRDERAAKKILDTKLKHFSRTFYLNTKM